MTNGTKAEKERKLQMEQRQRKTENDKWYKGSERQKMTNGTKAEKDRK